MKNAKFLISLYTCVILCISCSTPTEPELYIARDFTKENEFTAGIEGPVVDDRGILYAVNYEKEGTIGQVDSIGNVGLFVELPEGSTGNAICIDSKGNMLVADYTGHNILSINQEKEISVYAHDTSMNQPNDIAITSKDILYASDPDWSQSTGNLWMIKNGKVVLLELGMGTTNGIEVSPDEKKLYVNESVQRNVWVYDILDNDSLTNKRLLIKFEDGGMDGMKCDVEGNLYITRYDKGVVVKVSPEGKVIKEIKLKGQKPTNIAFGGKEGKTAFVTMQDRGCIETFEVESPGRYFSLINQ
ncbi:MAG TPA: SMP-30/gluconolactonase/LRE family protein [Cytophagaceae bacterium]